MRLLLLGGTGQVGREFQALTFPKGTDVVAPARADRDLTDPAAIATLIAAAPWDAVINAAAYTNVDRAESDQSVAYTVNADAPAHLAAETERHAIPLIHISTDYVFDGKKNAPYVETDAPAPLNVYGASKLAGERAVATNNARHVILRTSWVYSPYGHNFVKTILRLAAERDRLTIVDDQRGCPTSAREIAIACRDIALLCATRPGEAPYGLYHFTGGGEASWCEFARAIVDLSAPALARAPQIVPIKTIDYPTAAVRPADTRLDCTAIGRAFGIRQRPWRQALQEVLQETMAGLLKNDLKNGTTS
jgi:dTDP-4-dehydrorhamnose reductase